MRTGHFMWRSIDYGSSPPFIGSVTTEIPKIDPQNTSPATTRMTEITVNPCKSSSVLFGIFYIEVELP